MYAVVDNAERATFPVENLSSHYLLGHMPEIDPWLAEKYCNSVDFNKARIQSLEEEQESDLWLDPVTYNILKGHQEKLHTPGFRM